MKVLIYTLNKVKIDDFSMNKMLYGISSINVNLKMYSFDHLRMYNIDHINTCCSSR